MDEQRAIERLKQGDLAGLEYLVHRHQIEALRVADLITRDRAVAEDVVQNAFLRAAERIEQFESGRPFAPWFLRIVRNDAIKAARRRERTLSLHSLTGDGETALAQLLADRGITPEQAAEAGDLRDAVWQAMGRLPPEQRDAMVQRYYLDWSEAEMAAEAGAPRGTIKWRLHRAREQSRYFLRSFGSGYPRLVEKEREAE
ncbi:MAG: RNA polymerase sigma factor [Ardenticatenaceae bacterium]